MTDTDRLTAARYARFYDDYDRGTWFISEVNENDIIIGEPLLDDLSGDESAMLLSLMTRHPTLVCPDPADHELAAAVRRFTDAVAWVMEGGPDGEPASVWNSHGYEAKGATLQAALAAALEDKP